MAATTNWAERCESSEQDLAEIHRASRIWKPGLESRLLLGPL